MSFTRCSPTCAIIPGWPEKSNLVLVERCSYTGSSFFIDVSILFTIENRTHLTGLGCSRSVFYLPEVAIIVKHNTHRCNFAYEGAHACTSMHPAVARLHAVRVLAIPFFYCARPQPLRVHFPCAVCVKDKNRVALVKHL
ncbi:unnamed protein product [Ixodes persulcatus]